MLSDDLIRALPLMPRLTALELHGEPTLQPPPNGWPVGPCDADFLTQLAPALCPNLSDLRLSKFRALSDDTLLYFIQAHALRLTNIVAQFERKMQRDILQPLEPLIVGGLGVSLEYVPPK
jgi:hypothetical protein